MGIGSNAHRQTSGSPDAARAHNGHPHAALATPPAAILDAPTRQFYLKALDVIDGTGLRYVVAGAYALAYHAGIVRHTKDLDLFMRRQDVPLALEALERELGTTSDWAHPHWLAKSHAAYFRDLAPSEARQQMLAEAAERSLAEAATLVGRPAPSFEEYLRNYFAKT